MIYPGHTTRALTVETTRIQPGPTMVTAGRASRTRRPHQPHFPAGLPIKRATVSMAWSEMRINSRRSGAETPRHRARVADWMARVGQWDTWFQKE
jgi:hypothetical protein